MSTQYHKINNVFKRDMESKNKTLIDNAWTTEAYDYLQDNTWICTEKVDGTNIRIIVKDQAVEFRGKSDNAQMPIPLLKYLNENYANNQIKNNWGTEVCFYGEGYGGSIQKGGGRYGIDQKFVLFDVMIDGRFVSRKNVEGIAAQCNMKVVPIMKICSLNDAIQLVKTGYTSTYGDFIAEGLVCKPSTELQNQYGERIITKIKYVDFER